MATKRKAVEPKGRKQLSGAFTPEHQEDEAPETPLVVPRLESYVALEPEMDRETRAMILALHDAGFERGEIATTVLMHLVGNGPRNPAILSRGALYAIRVVDKAIADDEANPAERESVPE